MDNKIILGVISVFVVLAVIGSALTPMIDAYTTTTTAIDNEGAIGLRMDKVTSGDFTLNYGLVGDDFTATNGTDTQIINDMCIFYADDNVAVWMDDSSVRMVGKDANDQTIDAALSDEATITITKSADGVNITDGTVDQTFPVPAWSYVPKSTGAYGFFLNETEINTGGLDVHYVGSFAGVNCYDSINTHDLPLALDATVTDSILTGAKWIKAADSETELTPLEPGSLTPLDPGVISLDPEPDVSIMTVPTPTYTDGDWGYDLITGGYGVTVAKIVSYSGTGGGTITIPATVGGYDVKEVGKGGTTETVFNTSLVATGLTIPDGVMIIGSGAFNGCSRLTGSLIIPDSVTTIGSNAFRTCRGFTGSLIIPDSVTSIGSTAFTDCSGLTGSLIIPDSVTNISSNAFNGCSGFTGSLIIPDSVTNISSNVFTGCGFTSLIISMEQGGSISSGSFSNTTNLKEVLNLGSLEVTTTSYGLNADEVRSDISALGYLALVHQDGESAPFASLLEAIPVIVIISVVMLAISLFIARRME